MSNALWDAALIPPTADSATLPDLPTELIIDIYKAAYTFVTAERLSKTSHRLHEIWKIHADAILPSVVECFPQAQELARFQEDNLVRLPPSSSRQQTITTAPRICKDVNLLSSVLDAFQYACVRREGLTPLMPTERADFIRASYRAMTIAAEGSCRVSHSILEPLDMLAYMQIREAMWFLDIYFNTDRVTYDRARSIALVSRNLSVLHESLIRLPCFDFGTFTFYNFCKSKPHSYFTLADGCQKQVPKLDARLAELLPLLEGHCHVDGVWAHLKYCHRWWDHDIGF